MSAPRATGTPKAAPAGRGAMRRVYTGLDVNSDFEGRFPWSSRFVDVGGGVRQAVVDEGPRDARVTFLLLHGNATWGYLYRDFVQALSKDHRVIAPDHVGFGRSDKPRDVAYYSLERHVANLERTLDALHARHVVPVVHEWGGPIGMGWATRHADRVKGVVVLNTWAFVRDPPMRLPWLFRFLTLGKRGERNVRGSNIFTEMFLARGARRVLADDELAPYRAPHPLPDDRSGIVAFPRLIPPTRDAAHPSWGAMAAIEDELPKLQDKPALIVWATRDRSLGPAHLKRWASLFRDVDGPHLIPDAGPYLQEEKGVEIASHVRDWAGRLTT